MRCNMYPSQPSSSTSLVSSPSSLTPNSTHNMPSSPSQCPSTNSQVDHFSSLINRLNLPPRVANLARSIVHATTPNPPDPYTAACAVYIASSSLAQPQLPLSTLLSAAGSQLRIPHFFDTAKGIAADAASRLPTHSDPSRIVHLSHRAFMVCADVWRKLGQLVDTSTMHRTPHTQRLAWLFFLVCKAHLSSPTDSALAPVSAFHLMLACLVEAGLVAADSPVDALCSTTEAVPAEISRFRKALKDSLPPFLREKLPFYKTDADLRAICAQLASEYEALLFSAHHRHATDERVFIESPHLILSPSTDSEPSFHEPVTPTRSPRKRPVDPDVFQTPKKRSSVLRERMPVTPNRFARYPPSPRADDLDALAAVACSTPRSVVRPPRISPVPATPMTAGCAAVSWLQNLADTCEETSDPTKLSGPLELIKPSKDLEAVLGDTELWRDLMSSLRRLSDKLCEVMPEMNTIQRKREVMAVYISAIEGILTREASRLAKQRERFSEKLLRNNVFHRSVLTCSWELTAAAYGRRDMAVFTAAMKAFGLSAFSVTKAVESFVLRLPNIPRTLSKHMLTCDARMLESLAWQAGSELVTTLEERYSQQVEKADKPEESKKTISPPQKGNETDTTEDEQIQTLKPNTAKDFALEFFYKKMLSVASDRVQELLIMLRMDAIAEPVWSCVKHSVWEKWHLMVDRHLDQIIMCCVYGVSKVRRYQLKFKEIISTYRKMSYTREPSFSHLIPSVFRDLPLEAVGNSIATKPAAPTQDAHQRRGDIIKFYNQVFIHSMKAHLLNFQVNVPRSQMAATGYPIRNDSTLVDSLPNSTVEFPLSASTSHRTATGAPSQPGISKDRLSDRVMNSPLRVLRPHASPRRIGRVTVSPMSPGGRLAVLRQSPGRKTAILGSMTPGTRTLYAFGESPVRNLDRINRSLSNNTGRVRRPVPLNFEGRNVQARSESIRRRYADVLGMTGLRPGSTRVVPSHDTNSSEGSRGEGQGVKTGSANGSK